jgi:hypothetical protein
VRSWLDQDLALALRREPRQNVITAADPALRQNVGMAFSSCSPSHLVALVIDHVSRDVPLLVHSQNEIGAAAMRARLEQAGSDVTRIPMDQLTRERFLDRIEDACERDP